MKTKLLLNYTDFVSQIVNCSFKVVLRTEAAFGQKMVLQQERLKRSDKVKADWINREYIATVTHCIEKIVFFLNKLDMTCRNRLALLNEKLTLLEREMSYVEARLSIKN